MSKFIRLYGEIGEGECSAAHFIAALDAIPASQVEYVAINSGGGSYFDGLAIYNAICRRGNVIAVVDGLAASAASLIAFGAKKISMAPESHIMIHSPLTTARGNPAQLEKTLNTLRKIERQMAEVYSKRAFEMSVDEALLLMRAETWLDAQTAAQVFRGVEIDAMKVAAAIQPDWLDQYRNVPLGLTLSRHLKETTPPKPAPNKTEIDAARRRRTRQRKRMILQQLARSLDPAAAALDRRRKRLELHLAASQVRAAVDRERAAEATRRAAARDAIERAVASRAKAARYYRDWLNLAGESEK